MDEASSQSPVLKIIQIRQCEVCNKNMAVTSLKRHRKTVHKENIGKQIQCPDCGKHFQSKSRLIQHLASHRLNLADDPQINTLPCTDSAECKYKTTSKAYTWETTSEESTQHRPYQANGCALSGLAKKLQGLFWTITSMRNINKTTQTLNVQNVENHLLQRETWKGNKTIFIEIQTSPFQMTTTTLTSS